MEIFEEVTETARGGCPDAFLSLITLGLFGVETEIIRQTTKKSIKKEQRGVRKIPLVNNTLMVGDFGPRIRSRIIFTPLRRQNKENK